MTEESIKRMQEESIQTREGSSASVGGLFNWAINAGELISPWWSKRRDHDLRIMAKQNDHFSGALNALAQKFSGVPVHVEPRDATVKAYRDLSEYYESLLVEGSEFGGTVFQLMTRWFLDKSTQDNGAFMEVIGEGRKDGPIRGPALGLANLDASRCQRTGDEEFPVLYEDMGGKQYKLHRTRVIYTSEMPSPAAEMNKVGYCALSRVLNNVQHLADIGVYEQEQMGSRPKRRILLTGGGLDPEDIESAAKRADTRIDAQGLKRYTPVLVVGRASIANPVLQIVDITGAPDVYNKENSTTLGIFAIALAFNVPVRWIWPASAVGATKADAMFQHIAGLGGGLGAALLEFTYLLGGAPDAKAHMTGKFLPPTLRLVTDFQDDEQDRMVAEIRSRRAETRSKDIESGVISVRVAREQALSVGDLTDSQFEEMELEAGRLPDGQDVLSLFASTDDLIMRLLDLGVGQPLAIDLNDAAEMVVAIDVNALEAQDVMVNAPTSTTKQKAKWVISALNKLKEMYSEILSSEIQAEAIQAANRQAEESKQPPPQQGEEEEEEEKPQGEKPQGEKEPEEETETKQFNFGARMGEIIRGNLARGAGGRFVSADNLRSSMLGNLLARLRGQSRESGPSKAEQKRQKNREETMEKLGGRISGGAMDSILSLRDGESISPSEALDLTTRGLAETRDDGSVGLTSAGRKLMRAANAGDVDAALTALEDAKKVKKPKKGKGGGKSPEQRARELEEKKKLEQQQNRAKVGEGLGLAGEQFGAFLEFSDGADIDLTMARTLAGKGLVEIDINGTPRLSVQGRQLKRSADQGKIRDSRDALSAAADRVAQLQERAEDFEVRAGDLDDRVLDMEANMVDLSDSVATLQDRIDRATRQGGDATDLQAKLDAATEKLTTSQEKIDQLRQRAEDARTAADSIRRRVGQSDAEKAMWDLLFKAGQEDFRAGIRSAVRGYWSGKVDRFGFTDMMISTLERGLNRAWLDGFAKEGLTAEDLTDKEKNRIKEIVNEQISYVLGFADDIADGSKAEGGKLEPHFRRADVWVRRYNQVQQEAETTAAGDKKKVWIIDPAKDNCQSCLKLSGKVRRASWWLDSGILPQQAGAEYLECRGFLCGCALEDTDSPQSKGPMPGLP